MVGIGKDAVQRGRPLGERVQYAVLRCAQLQKAQRQARPAQQNDQQQQPPLVLHGHGQGAEKYRQRRQDRPQPAFGGQWRQRPDVPRVAHPGGVQVIGQRVANRDRTPEPFGQGHLLDRQGAEDQQ